MLHLSLYECSIHLPDTCPSPCRRKEKETDHDNSPHNFRKRTGVHATTVGCMRTLHYPSRTVEAPLFCLSSIRSSQMPTCCSHQEHFEHRQVDHYCTSRGNCLSPPLSPPLRSLPVALPPCQISMSETTYVSFSSEVRSLLYYHLP